MGKKNNNTAPVKDTKAKKSEGKKKDTNAAALENALDTAKKLKDNAADIGTAIAPKLKHDRIIAARDAVSSDTEGGKVYRLVLTAAANAHRTAVSDSVMKNAGIKEETRTEYLFKVATVYRAAANFADKFSVEGEAKKVTRNALFKEWKDLLQFLSGSAVKATADDAFMLMNSAQRTVKAGLSYEAYTRQDGGVGAKMTSGVASKAAVSAASFQKELEMHVVNRLLGFDGIMSYNAAKTAISNNGNLRSEAVKSAETQLKLEKATETAAPETAAAQDTNADSEVVPVA